MKVGIINYGAGNLGSIYRTIEKLGRVPAIIDHAVDLRGHDALILPGVGNFTDCMEVLVTHRWLDAIREEVLGYEKPLLGICLGMQLLADVGFEGAKDSQMGTPGLGLVSGSVVRLQDVGCELRVPHVGWNSVDIFGPKQSLFGEIPNNTDFYFVHSYAFVPVEQNCIIATTCYGNRFVSAVGRDRVFGTQFHPEKSSRAGLQLLRNFLQIRNA
jgi:glutamine amidotransferase